MIPASLRNQGSPSTPSPSSDDLARLRMAMDADRRRLCAALGLRADNGRFFCPSCQSDGHPHADGDFSIEAGFKCHRCGWSGDGLGLVRLVKSCAFRAAVVFAGDVYGIRGEDLGHGIKRTMLEPYPTAMPAREKKTHPTIDAAVNAACWSVEQAKGHKWIDTRRDIYRDVEGNDFMAVIRYEREDGARKPDGKAVKEPRPIHAVEGGWKVGRPPGKCLLFKLPELRASDGAVFAVEGEKPAGAGTDIELTCTTWPFGAEGIGEADFSPLAGRDVILLPDNDAPGRKSMQGVAAILAVLNPPARLRIVELPGLPPKGDLADFVALRAGQSPESIRGEVERLASAAPTWTPAKCETPTAPPVSATPPLTIDAESIRARLWKIAQEKLGATECYRKQADVVIDWLHSLGQLYYNDVRQDFASVMFFDNERKMLWPVQSDAFLAWLADNLAMSRAERSFLFVASAIETEGLSPRATGLIPSVFWHATPSMFYLSNGPGSMVRISAHRTDIVDNGTDGVLFPYGSTLAPWSLITPRDPFETCTLFRDMSTVARHGRTLFKLFVCSLPSDPRTKPQLSVSGMAGSGKTKLVTGIFELYGMPARVNAIHKNGESDFWVAMESGGLTCFDNVDTRIDWLADALSAASTGGAQQKRMLYKDLDFVTLRARSWVALTSTSPTFASDAGLSDRLLVIRLNRRKGETAETALSDEIRLNRDAGLSWICEILSLALADQSPVPSGLNARHPDFASLAVRIGRAMGEESEAIAAMRAAEADKGMYNLENDSIGTALLELMQSGTFTGSAEALRAELTKIESGFEGKLSARGLSKRLLKLWPHLESILKADQKLDGHSKSAVYTFHPPACAEYAGYQTGISEKSLYEKDEGGLSKTAFDTPHTPQIVQEPVAWNRMDGPESRKDESP